MADAKTSHNTTGEQILNPKAERKNIKEPEFSELRSAKKSALQGMRKRGKKNIRRRRVKGPPALKRT